MSYYFVFTEKQIKAFIIAAIIFLSLLIISEFATLWMGASVRVLPSTTENTNKILTKDRLFHRILKASVFGVYVPNDLNEDNVKKSLLDLTLVGILLADTKSDSQVIIRSATGDEKTYTVGDTVPGGAVIKRITAEGVLLERNGALERISLPKSPLFFEPAPKPLQEEQ